MDQRQLVKDQHHRLVKFQYPWRLCDHQRLLVPEHLLATLVAYLLVLLLAPTKLQKAKDQDQLPNCHLLYYSYSSQLHSFNLFKF